MKRRFPHPFVYTLLVFSFSPFLAAQSFPIETSLPAFPSTGVQQLNALQVVLDTDGDGIPDDWEIANGLDPNNPADAAMDPDGDGMSNLQEYRVGTNPHDPSSRFALVAAGFGTTLCLTWQFNADLYQANQVAAAVGEWTLVSGATVSPYCLTIGAEARYFKLLLGDDLFSVNTVGYINLSAPHGSNFICGPLIGNNTVGVVIPSPPDETVVTQDGIENWYFTDFGGWDFPNMLLDAGKGFELWNPGTTPVTLTFIGDVPAAPGIATAPRSQNVLFGTNLDLFVVALGIPAVSYQWRFNGTNIPNARSSILTLNNVQLTNSGNYDVMISNSFGMRTSAVAVVQVGIPPTITTQPQSQTAFAGAPVTLTVSALATPPPLHYQWYLDQTNVIANATNRMLKFEPLYQTNAGAYRVVVSNSFGVTTSAVATITVTLPPPPVLSIQLGAAAVISFTTLPGLSYQLEFKDSLSSPAWSLLAHVAAMATGGTISILDPNPSTSRFYRVHVFGSSVGAARGGGMLCGAWPTS